MLSEFQLNMLEIETMRKPKHERKRKNQRSKSQTGTIGRRESSTGKFGNFEIISYAPIVRRPSSIVQVTIGRSPSVIDSTSCILNANSNQGLLAANGTSTVSKSLSASESTLEFIRNSKLRSSPYRSKTVMSQMSQEKETKKVEKVFLSEKQSKNLKECGSSMPGAPPATPTQSEFIKQELKYCWRYNACYTMYASNVYIVQNIF